MLLTASCNSFSRYPVNTGKSVRARLYTRFFGLIFFLLAFSYLPAGTTAAREMQPAPMTSETAAPRNVAISRDGSYAIVIEADSYRLWKIALNGTGKKRLSLFADNLPAKPLCIVETESGFRIFGPLRGEISQWILGRQSRSRPFVTIDIDRKGRFLRTRRHTPAAAPAMTQPR